MISKDAQKIIDRLAAHAWDRQNIDREAVEIAISRHLAELGLPVRPFQWLTNAKEGYAAARDAARAAASAAAWDAARDAAWDAARAAAWDAARAAARAAAWDAASAAASDAASDAAWDAAWDAARAAAWDAARDAAWAATWAAAWAAARAATEVNALSVFDHITQAKLVAIWLPMVDAFDAGLWLYWITPIEVICVEQPCLHISENRLHREDGPAVYWPSGESYYFWRGVQVPGEWISDKKSLTASLALTWDNIEQRRCACEIIGWARILAELDATVIDHDDDPHVGDLVEVNLPDVGRERFLRVLCGTGREFAIPVPPSITTAIGGQAWTYGYDDPKSFRKPEVRT